MELLVLWMIRKLLGLWTARGVVGMR